jgi:Ca-activated chloride channel family protein
MRVFATVLLIGLVALGYSQASQSTEVGVVSGVVLDPAGKPIAGATVELRIASTIERRGATNSRGEFRFERVPSGSYEVHAEKPGFPPATVRVTVTASTPVSLSLTLAFEPQRDESRQRAGDKLAPGVPPPPPPPAAAPIAPKAATESAAAMSPGAPGAGRGGYGGGGYRIGDLRRADAPFNTEAYDKIDENRFHRVADDPLSTFSIDVDSASYSNVRRFLNQGQLPPPDAVRIEELINYFRFGYKEPGPEAPFSITTEVSVCPWNPRHKLALIGLQARGIDDDRTPPRNLVFLLDVSGSMMPPDKLPLVKAAMRMLVDTLTPADRVAIVVYAGASGLVLPSTPGSRKAEIQRAIAELQAGGSTNGAAGIQLAYEIAVRSFIPNGINRVILATDGDFNVGVTNQGELIRLIEEKRNQGVFLSVLGVGTGNLKDSTMEKLADKGNGNYAYLDSLHEARKVLVAEAGATLVTVAKDVKIQVEFNPRSVGAYKLIGYENRILQHQDFNDDKKDAGEIGAGHTVTALYEIVPPGEPIEGGTVDPLKYQDRNARPSAASDSGELMTVKIRYKQPNGETSKLLSRVVSDRVGPLTPQLGFASSVAEFGMLLRRSPFKGKATWSTVQELARRHRGEDVDGYRSEFIRLVELAASLDRHGADTDDRR